MTGQHDQNTVAYFDRLGPQWSPGRYRRALEVLHASADPDSRLIDIGCGNGNILKMIRENSVVEHVTGLDPSESYLASVRAQLRCETICGSILDDSLVTQHAARFDFALIGDVLHHLVGSSRRRSRDKGRQALRNALVLLKDGGQLMIMEPLFRPALVVTAVFYVKLVLTSRFPNRLELFGRRWLNIGAPVVAFYSKAQLTQLVRDTHGATLIDVTVSPLRHIGYGVRHARMTLVVRKQSS